MVAKGQEQLSCMSFNGLFLVRSSSLCLFYFSGRFKRPTTYASCLIASQFILSNTHSQLITPMILTPYLLFNLYVLPCFVLVVAIDPLALVSPP